MRARHRGIPHSISYLIYLPTVLNIQNDVYEVLHFNYKIMEQLTLKKWICVGVNYSVFFSGDMFIPSEIDQHKQKKIIYIPRELFIIEMFIVSL